jgi:hypothetical protein
VRLFCVQAEVLTEALFDQIIQSMSPLRQIQQRQKAALLILP